MGVYFSGSVGGGNGGNGGDGGMIVGGKRYRLKEGRETEGRRERREWSKSLKRRKNASVGGCAEEVLAVGVQKGWE